MTVPYPNGGTPPTTFPAPAPLHPVVHAANGALPFTGSDILFTVVVAVAILTVGLFLAVRYGAKRTRKAAQEALR